MNRTLHLLADDPISEPSADMLNRRVFAGQVVEVIRLLPARESSTVMALIGPWGSGKSSLLGLVTQTLKVRHSEEWKVVNFNPWEASSLDGLMVSFFEAISSAIPDELRKKTVGKTLRGYARKLLSLGGAFQVPGAGFIDLGKLAEGLEKLLEDEESTQVLKQRLEAALAELPQRILVVIDDLDRLMPDELLTVFKLIRLLGRLSGIHYLLAYDEQTLLSVLKESQLARANSDRALAYLEKIVQVRLDLPTVHRAQAIELIQSCVRELLSVPKKPVSEQERTRLKELLESDLLVRLNEPRSIKRFFAQVAAYLPLVVHVVDLPDFVALSYLRTFHPMLYRELHRRKRELLPSTRSAESAKERPNWNQIAKESGVPDSEAKTIEALITEIFYRSARSSSSSQLPGAAVNRRAADPHYFDRYFYFGVPPGDLSEVELEAMFSRMRRAGAEADLVQLEGWLQGKLELMLPKLKAVEPGLDAFQRAYLLIALAHQYRDVLARGESLLKHRDFSFLAVQSFKGLSDDAAEFVMQTLTDLTEIRFLFMLMHRLSQQEVADLQGTSGQKLLLALAHRVPEILAAQTGQALPEVRWCIELASAWANVVGPKPVHDWMGSQFESGKTSWRVEELVGCCVVGVEPSGNTYLLGDLFGLDTLTLDSLVPRPWLLETLSDKIQSTSKRGLHPLPGTRVPFDVIINYGLRVLSSQEQESQ